MRLYLDDDCAARLLIEALRRAGHDVQTPAEISKSGVDDSIHLLHAIQQKRVLITGNYHDFENLHNLVVQSGGTHPGILAIRKDRDRRRNMKPNQVVQAVAKLMATIANLTSQFVVLNHWR